MTGLVIASCLFLGIHLGISGTKLRDVVTGAIGEPVYRGLFAITSLGAVVWLCIAYNRAFASPANTVLFDAGQGLRDLAIPVVGFALLLALPGVMRGNPTSAGQDKAQVGGMLRITRHPFLIGATLWSGFHLIAAGTLASTILFATFFIVATVGMPAIDRKVRRKRTEDWKRISAETSIIPFAAIVAGRNRFVTREVFDWRFAVAVAIVLALLYFHFALFGVPAFPPNWLPG